jgi:hypothetical protein
MGSNEREELLNIVDNLYPIIRDLIEYLEGVAVDLLRRYKLVKLEEFKCPRCSVTMSGFEREYHMLEHEFDEVRRRIIEGYEILDKSRYPLVYKYFEYEITVLIKEKIPMFKGLAEEINRRIGERKLRSLSVNHLYLIGDVLEMLKNIQREIRRMFVVEYMNLDKVVSRAGFTKLLNIVKMTKH